MDHPSQSIRFVPDKTPTSVLKKLADKTGISAKDLLIEAGLWIVPGGIFFKGLRWAHKGYQGYKLSKTAVKLYKQSDKLYKTKKLLDKFSKSYEQQELTKLEPKEFKFDVKKFDVKPKDVANIKDANLPNSTNTSNNPSPGEVDTYLGLKSISKKGDGLIRHHTPFKKYMAQHDVKTDHGISVLISEKTHTKLHQILKKQQLNQSPRQALLEATKVLKQALKETNSYTPEMRRAIIKTIRQNKEKYPHIFIK